ncbi:hypothetical protein JL720_12146 [Aureococcus anophagefferens]|nr:hypothetical protein JL720_12146 [Aureococcus anophagefferens]
MDAAAPTCDASGTEAGVAAAAAAAVDALDFVGLTEHLHTSLCLFYFTYDLTAPFHRDCRGSSKAPVYNRAGAARAGRGRSASPRARSDALSTTPRPSSGPVAAMGRATGYRDAVAQPRPRRREALPPPDEQEDPAAALARLEALFDVDDDHDVAEAPRGPASLQEKLDAASDDAANALTAVVRGYSLEKRSAAAWASFDAAVAAGYYDPSPPTEAFDAVLHCCAHQQLPERALNVVDDMRRNGVPRTGATYAALMKAVATAPQWHRAYRLATDDVLDAMEGDRVAPTPALYVHLIGACGREADPAAFAAVDDLGAGFHRKRDEPAGAVVTVAEEAAEEDDDRAGVEATLAALEGDVDDATRRAARRRRGGDGEELAGGPRRVPRGPRGRGPLRRR